MRSLQGRLAAGLALSLLLLLGLQYALVSGAIRDTAEGYIADRLRHDTDNLLAALQWGPEGPSLAAEDALYQRPYSGHYYRIEAGGESLRSRSLWEGRLPLPAVGLGEVRRLRATGPQGQPLLLRVAGLRKEGRTVRIAVAEDLSPLYRDLRAFQWRYGLVSLAVGAGLLGLQWALLALGMRPLGRLREQIGRLERGERSALSEAVPAEVRPLVRELNRLLEVLDERLQRSRRAMGDLAHALKTPLTRLCQAAEEGCADPELRRRLLEPAEQIQQRIDRELKRARLAAGAPGQRFDPGRELPALIRVLERVYAERGLRLRYTGPDPGLAFADREDMLELAGNLLDNACKWARSEARIRVEAQPAPALIVEDDGPGVPPEHREALTRRGVRLDEAAEGFGLGLAIVGDLVAAYRGRLDLETSADLGGLAVRVTLPEDSLSKPS